jgi:hypothetical protein
MVYSRSNSSSGKKEAATPTVGQAKSRLGEHIQCRAALHLHMRQRLCMWATVMAMQQVAESKQTLFP